MLLNTPCVHGGDIYRRPIRLDFSVNVNPLGTPAAVKAAVRQAAEHLDAYPDPYCTRLREALSASLHVPADWVLCGNGAAELIYQFVSSLHPERALLPAPSFADYETALRAAGCVLDYVPLLRKEGFLPTEGILDAITERTELVMLCSPNNPTGRLVPRPLLGRILARCRETGTWLFLDECFTELTDRETPSLSRELHDGDRVFLLRAFTKTYAMAGLRLGYAVCPRREMLECICGQNQCWNVSAPAQAAGIAALGCGDWAEKARAVIRQEKRWLTGELEGLGIAVLPSDANFLLLSGVSGLYEGLLKRGILIRDCSSYRGLQHGDCRIAIKTHEENRMLLAAVREVLHGQN